jgi:hypothetical protein
MQVIGITKLYCVADQHPHLASTMRAIVARLMVLENGDIATLAKALGAEAEGDRVNLRLSKPDIELTMRYDQTTSILLIVAIEVRGAEV